MSARAALAAVFVAAWLFAASFVVAAPAGAWSAGTDGAPVANITFHDFPDPSGVGTGAGTAQLYGTGTPDNVAPGVGYAGIATESWTPGTSTYGASNDALVNPGTGTIPTTLVADGNFAPTVSFIGGQWVMWFTGLRAGGGQACLYTATSAAAGGPFSLGTYTLCGPTWGYFDPSIYQDPSGNLWLLYSEEVFNAPGTNNNIVVTQLAANGLQPVGNATTLATFADIVSNLPLGTGGSNEYVENPTWSAEPAPYQDAAGHVVAFNLYVSWGSWDLAGPTGRPASSGDYHTVKIPCASITQCDPGLALNIDNQLAGFANPADISNTGGAAFVTATSGPPYSYLLFAAPQEGAFMPREMYWESGSTGPPQLMAGEELANGQCLPNATTGWELCMGGDGDLRLLGPGPGQLPGARRWQPLVTKWDSKTAGSVRSFTQVQTDGNLVVSGGPGGPVQSLSNTAGHPGAYLTLLDNNDLVLASASGTTLWHTST